MKLQTMEKDFIHLRALKTQKDFLKEAATIEGKSLTSFLLESAMNAAKDALDLKYKDWLKQNVKK